MCKARRAQQRGTNPLYSCNAFLRAHLLSAEELPPADASSFSYVFHGSSAQKGFLSSPSGAGRPAAKQSNFIVRFINNQILAPEHRAGNLSIVWGVSVFAAGIIAARKFGDLITPVF